MRKTISIDSFPIQVRPSICLEAGVEYEIKLDFGDKRTNAPDR